MKIGDKAKVIIGRYDDPVIDTLIGKTVTVINIIEDAGVNGETFYDIVEDGIKFQLDETQLESLRHNENT